MDGFRNLVSGVVIPAWRQHGWMQRLVAFCLVFVPAILAFTLLGCGGDRSEVVVYSALDQEFAEPVLLKYSDAFDADVPAKFDTESTKTVGLANAIISEAQRPRCDLFWNNEILHTIRLKKAGLLEPYISPVGQEYPATFRDPDKCWYGFAARARVFIINTDLLPDAESRPTSIRDLAEKKWKGKGAIARPLFGTTATHAAVLYSKWGDSAATQFFADVKKNAKVLSGNKQVAQAVGRGEFAFGLTDTDDAIIELESGKPVIIVFPDQLPEESGTLFIPNTLCLIKGGPHPQQARSLLNFLLRPETEMLLAGASSAQIPLHPEDRVGSRVLDDQEVRWMTVDFEAAADKWESASATLREMFGEN